MILNLLNKKIMIILVKPMKINKVIKRFYPGNNTITVSTIKNSIDSLNLVRKYPLSSFTPYINTKQIGIYTRTSTSTEISPRVQFPKPLIKHKGPVVIQHEVNSSPQASFVKFLSILLEKKLKTFSGKEYTTTLTEKVEVNDITDEQLIEEMLKRELIKKDIGNTAITVKLKDDTDYILGSSKNNIKLSSLGQAYVESMKIPSNNATEELPILKDKEFVKENFKIIVPPERDSSLFIETGKQKHLLAITDSLGNYYAVGYLTSKHSGVFISEKQFKSFQDTKEKEQNHENNNINKENDKIVKEKTQKIVFFKNCIKINVEDLRQVKWDSEYFSSLTKDSFDILITECNTLKEKPSIIFDTNGITKEVCLQMCIEHDKNALKENKHPLSLDQINQNKINQEKQKEKSKLKIGNKIINTTNEYL
jgi:hypothetical protein